MSPNSSPRFVFVFSYFVFQYTQYKQERRRPWKHDERKREHLYKSGSFWATGRLEIRGRGKCFHAVSFTVNTWPRMIRYSTRNNTRIDRTAKLLDDNRIS